MEPYLDHSKEEFGLHVDADVALWQEYRSLHKLSPLHAVQNSTFVIMNDQLMNDFEQFKRKEVPLGSSILKCNELLKLWLSQTKEGVPFRKYGDEYVCLLSTQIDGLCQWVMDMREKVVKNGEKVHVDMVGKSCQETEYYSRNEQQQAKV